MRHRTPSTAFLVVIAALLLVVCGYMALALVGGCEDATAGECHESFRYLVWIPFSLLVAVLTELVRRGVSRP